MLWGNDRKHNRVWSTNYTSISGADSSRKKELVWRAIDHKFRIKQKKNPPHDFAGQYHAFFCDIVNSFVQGFFFSKSSIDSHTLNDWLNTIFFIGIIL